METKEIEHFVLLAGAYNLGFFLFELAEYFIFYNFLFFKTVMCVQKGETAMNHTPVYTFGLGHPPKTKHNLFTFKTQST